MTEALETGDGTTRATIPNRYLREMLGNVADPASLLVGAGLGASWLEHPGLRATGEATAAVYRAVVRTLDDELFGYFTRPVPRGTYATLVRLMTGCRNVRAALDAATELYRLFDAHAHWALEVESGRVALSCCPRTETHRSSLLYAHAMLLTPWRTASWLAQAPFEIQHVELDRRFAEYSPESTFLFGLAPEHGDRNAIHFSSEALDWPIRRRLEEVEPWVRSGSFEAIIARAPRGSLETRVRTALIAATPIAGASLPEVARRLGLSRPTLTRKLRERGLSFRTIKDALRRDHAIGELAAGATVAQCAEALGYSEPSAFQRAFKTWTGLSPGRYRREVLASGPSSEPPQA